MIVLAERKESTPASTWTTYLCLLPLENGSYRLDIRSRPPICEYSEWMAGLREDEVDFDDMELPDSIDGVDVYGIEDGFILADELPEPLNDEEMSGEFTTQSLGVAKEALERWNWQDVSELDLLSSISKIPIDQDV